MDFCLKLIAFTCCLGVVFSRAAPSTVVKSTVTRSRTTRNAVNEENKSDIPQFLKIQRGLPAVTLTGLHTNRVLECEANGSPPPTIHWLRNGRVFKQSPEEEAMEESNAISQVFTPMMAAGSTKSRLYLDCAGPQDEGEYTCVAETPYQRTSVTTKVTVTDAIASGLDSMCVSAKKSLGTQARIGMWSGSMLETIGNDAVLYCRTVGGPHPHVMWYNDESTIKNNAKYQVQENGDLLIRNLEWADMGEYYCVAENSLGHDTISTFLYPLKPED